MTGDSTINSYSSERHAFIGDVINGLTDLGTLGGTLSRGQAINNSGQVTGFATTSGNTASHAFITDAITNVLTDIGTLGGTFSGGRGINDSAQVVGSSTNGAGMSHAFLWDSGTMYDLNNLIDAADPLRGIFILSSANGINSFGDIVGTGVNASGATHAFILTAQRSSSSSVPEPVPLALLGLGLLGLAIMRKRQR